MTRGTLDYDPLPSRSRSKHRVTRPLASFFRIRAQLSPAEVRTRFALFAALSDLAAITFSAGLVGYVYHEVLYRTAAMTIFFLLIGFCLALLFIGGSIIRDEYDILRYMTFRGHARRTFLTWNTTFVAALVFVFATKTTGDFSRATMTLLYCTGFAAMLVGRRLIVNGLKRNEHLTATTAQRIFLVGDEQEIARFTAQYDLFLLGLRLVGAYVLRGPQTMSDDLALAAASARMLRPDDIFILLPWSQEETIEACVGAFKRVPAAIHLGLERVLVRFADARVSRIGTITGLNLVRHPLTRAEVALKRIFDIVVAGFLSVTLLPFFLLIALAIKLESRGPVLFLQTRYGFNQEPFRIVKFRSMTTLEDGRAVRQAEKDDDRVTRVGRFMRRYNIDEIAQLFNVLRGEMSLVGPRPHALAHDQLFEQSIADYARRHNVKPGITGWAQVNGLRGPIHTDAMIERRIEHDLFYIDNWSLMLDLRILFLTVVSAKAYLNAL